MIVFLHLILGVLLAMRSVSSVAHQQMTTKIVGEFDDKIVSQFQRLRIKGSKLDCQHQCIRDRECMSFFHDQTTHTCQTHGVVFFNPNDGKSSLGSRYYRPFEDVCPSHRGYIHNRALDFCYKFHFQSKGNFTYARQSCKGEGGDLVIADTKAKLYHIAQTIKATTFPISRFMVGATDVEVKGDWRWLDGKQVDPNFWMPGKPDESYKEDYATIHDVGDLPGCLNDMAWAPDVPFICELII